MHMSISYIIPIDCLVTPSFNHTATLLLHVYLYFLADTVGLDGSKRPMSQEGHRCKYPGECGQDHAKEKAFTDMTKTVEIFKTESHRLLPSITLAPATPLQSVDGGDAQHAVRAPPIKQPTHPSISKRNVRFSMADLVKKEDEVNFENLSSWAKKGLRRKKGPKGPLADPRFQSLSRHLSDLHQIESVPNDIHVIIDHNDSLHVPSKRPKLPGGMQGKMSSEIRAFLENAEWLR